MSDLQIEAKNAQKTVRMKTNYLNLPICITAPGNRTIVDRLANLKYKTKKKQKGNELN